MRSICLFFEFLKYEIKNTLGNCFKEENSKKKLTQAFQKKAFQQTDSICLTRKEKLDKLRKERLFFCFKREIFVFCKL